jgi:hypothetical protein
MPVKFREIHNKLIASLFILGNAFAAETINIRGTVQNDSGIPLKAVIVTLLKEGVSTTTDYHSLCKTRRSALK